MVMDVEIRNGSRDCCVRLLFQSNEGVDGLGVLSNRQTDLATLWMVKVQRNMQQGGE